MSTTPEDEPTLEDRVAQLESSVELLTTGLDSAMTANELLTAGLDSAMTANEVLQTRYGALADQYAALADQYAALAERVVDLEAL